MAKPTPNTLPPKGAEHLGEILTEVGWALTCWEEAESQIVSLYEASLGNKILFEEHVENFCRLGRSLRVKALKKKIEQIAHLFENPSAQDILDSLKHLESLAQLRNEIAHGVCMKYSATHNGEQVMNGLYILPSEINGRYVKPSPKYAHNIETLRDFCTKVRLHRWTLVEATGTLLRNQPDDQGENGVVPSWTINAVVGVLQRRYKPSHINEVVKRALEIDNQMNLKREIGPNENS